MDQGARRLAARPALISARFRFTSFSFTSFSFTSFSHMLLPAWPHGPAAIRLHVVRTEPYVLSHLGCSCLIVSFLWHA